MTFTSRRKNVPDRDLIMRLMQRPRTTEEIADRLRVGVREAGQLLGILADQGAIIRAERHEGIQIWDPVK